MDTTTIIFSVGFAVLLATFLWYLLRQQRKEQSGETSIHPETRQLQLQAYERLTLLTERITLPNLVSRLNQPGLDARDMQMILVQNIKQEFEYNITQQIYVSTEAWNAVKNLKDQNMLVVNQLAGALPVTASGSDLNRLILDYSMNDRRGSLHDMVGEVLRFEAKKLM
jgi:hypothetical protein